MTQVRHCTQNGGKCTGTDTTTIAAVGHNYGNWTQKTAATCTAAKVEKRTCKTCSKEETRTSGSALEHNYGSWTEKAAATCTTGKVEKRICTVCSNEETRTSFPLGHSYGSWTEKTAATCTTAKVEKRTCTRCAHEETQTSGSALGHDMKYVFTLGVYSWYKCDRCDHTDNDWWAGKY